MPEHDHAAHLPAVREEIESSPIYQLLGLRIEEMNQGRARLRLPAREHYHQIYGVVHGGIVATVADACIGLAFITLIGPAEQAITVELKVNYIAPFATGELVGEGHIVHKGRTLGFGEAELRDQEGRLVATASATYLAKRRRAQERQEP